MKESTMDRFDTDVMDDLMTDAAEGPARSMDDYDAYDEADEVDQYDKAMKATMNSWAV